MDIYINDIFEIASGKNEDGQPNAASSLVLMDQQEGEDPEILKNLFLEAPVQIHHTKGAVVCTFDFTISQISIFMNAYHTCLSWLNEEEEGVLFLNMLPMKLKGKVNMLFSYLTYCDCYEFKNGIRRLILVFDNTETMLSVKDEVDYEELEREIEGELKTEERELEEEIFQLEKELGQINEELSGFHYEFDPFAVKEEEGDNITSPEPGVRFVKEDGERDEEY